MTLFMNIFMALVIFLVHLPLLICVFSKEDEAAKAKIEEARIITISEKEAASFTSRLGYAIRTTSTS